MLAEFVIYISTRARSRGGGAFGTKVIREKGFVRRPVEQPIAGTSDSRELGPSVYF